MFGGKEQDSDNKDNKPGNFSGNFSGGPSRAPPGNFPGGFPGDFSKGSPGNSSGGPPGNGGPPVSSGPPGGPDGDPKNNPKLDPFAEYFYNKKPQINENSLDDPKRTISILNSFNTLPKYTSLDRPDAIFKHIKNFIRHYHIINISNYPLQFQILVFLRTFEGQAKQILEPLHDERHQIYSHNTLEEAIKEIKEIFCSDFQRQILKKIFNNFVLRK